ncbi:MAG TPA: DUF4234 domain-containing protein [Polyangiaceae bacterium]|nr:DUF4234 domain-containing protein [Polyangiaceae bacterium]
MSDPLTNPYAPPAEAPPAGIGAGGSTRDASDYSSEQRNVLILILLCIVTLGLYPGIWYVRRARFLESLDSDKKLGPLPWFSLALLAALVLAAIAGVETEVVRLIEAASGLANLFLAFRVAAVLRSDFARTGRFIGISTAGVFFFGCLYLQHLLNEAAEVPARRGTAEARSS